MGIARPILLAIPNRFVGPRVLLRPYADADAQVLHATVRDSHEHLEPWGSWPVQLRTLDETREYIRRRMAWWALRERLVMGIFSRQDGSLLGGMGFHVASWKLPAFELGYWLCRSAQGHGYVSEAARLLTVFGFETLGAQRMVIRCDARNARSIGVPRRLGYVLEGCLRRSELDSAGQPCDMLIFALTPDDYRRVRAASGLPQDGKQQD